MVRTVSPLPTGIPPLITGWFFVLSPGSGVGVSHTTLRYGGGTVEEDEPRMPPVGRHNRIICYRRKIVPRGVHWYAVPRSGVLISA